MAQHFQRLCGLARKAITGYDMIQDGDKICVGVSGGKDSVALALTLKKLQGYMNVKFDMVAVTLDLGFGGKEGDFSSLEKLFAEHGIEYVVKRTEIGEIIMDKLKKLDAVSYVRFASVYREFKDVATFMEELKLLNK